MIHVLLLLAYYTVHIQADIILPSFGNLTYIQQSSDIRLPWTYKVSSGTVTQRLWRFSKTSKPTNFKDLALINDDGNPRILNDTFPEITVIKPATLVLKNANLGHNGTYRMGIVLFGVSDPPPSDILVIILDQPIAVTNCSDERLNEGDDIICLCESTAGNPPPTASWSKGGVMIDGTGYLKKYLILKNVNKENIGTYTCTMQSHNLADEKSFKLEVQYKPMIKSFKSDQDKNIASLGDSVKITCVAEGLPAPNYNISHSGSRLIHGAVKGEWTITSANYSHAGSYECIAYNSLGSGSYNFIMNVTKVKTPTTVKPSNSTPTITTKAKTTDTDGTSAGGKGGAGLSIGGIVGIIIAALFVLVLIVVLIWWFCFRGDKDDTESEEQVVRPESSNVGSMPRNDENDYETVDKEKVKRADEAGPSNANDPQDANGSGMPPVYAVVDKRKTKKATQPPAVTYAALDSVALQPDSSKMRNRDREETNYASINLENLQSDLV